MSKWTQDKEFKDANQQQAAQPQPQQMAQQTQAQQQVEEEVQEEQQKKPFLNIPKKLQIPFVGLCILAFLGVLYWQISINLPAMKDPNSIPDDLTNDGISSGGDLDDFLNFEEVFSYTDDERKELRAWGYTGTEIEEAQAAKRDATEMVEESRRAQEEARASLSNPESPEYKALLAQTWLGEPSVTVPEYDEWMVKEYVTLKLNADYEKIPAHSGNLFIKVDMGDGTFYFMQCDVVTYSKLADKGNINVQYDRQLVEGNYYICNMRQIEV